MNPFCQEHRPLIEFFAAALAGLIVSGCSSGSTPPGPATAAANRPAVAASQPAKGTNLLATAAQSVFHADAPASRDPFFPELSQAPTAAAAPFVRLPITSYLKLAGIWPGKSRPMALINRTPLAPGEEGDVSIIVTNQLSKPEIQKINIRCLEVRQDSVLIRIDGEQGVKELKIAQGK
jgi:hypothetical protein